MSRVACPACGTHNLLPHHPAVRTRAAERPTRGEAAVLAVLICRVALDPTVHRADGGQAVTEVTMSGGSPRSSSAREPCLGCGEETAVGSVFFSDRHTVEHADGTWTYLCTLCDARIRSSRRGKRLTDEEVRDIVENGSMGAISWAGRGG